jgi:phage baseplate assembly protein W
MKNSVFTKTGWPFFPRIVNNGERLQDLTYSSDIHESLDILFTTLPGERIAHPLYGCDLMQYMFRPINNALISEMTNTISNAIVLFEPRIKLLDVVITPNEEILYQLDISIAYMLLETSSRYNITIPFFTMEQDA